MGTSVEGKTVIVVDDMIASGTSMIEAGERLREKGAKKVFFTATFSMFMEEIGRINMKKNELLQVKKLYQQELKRKKEIIKLLNTKSVIRYIDIMKYEIPTIELDEDTMLRILESISISSDDIYINLGKYVTYNEDSPYEHSVLLKPADLNGEVIKGQLMRHIISEYDIRNIYYALATGKMVYYIPYNKQIQSHIVIMLPSIKKKIENLGEYDGTNGCIFRQERLFDRFSEDYEILRSQYFINLMNEDESKVIEYYSDENNWSEIENNVKKYYKKKGEKNE